MTTLQSRGVRDSLLDLELERVIRVAAIACHVPMAMLAFLDEEGEWFAAKLGVESEGIPREGSLSVAVMAFNELVEVADATTSELFRDCDLVAGAPHIKFFAGIPIPGAGSHVTGVLSVADTVSKKLEAPQREALYLLAHHVKSLLEHQTRVSSLQEAVTTESALVEGLRDSQRILQTLISNLPGVAYRCRNDVSWSVEFISEGCRQLTGHPASELIEGAVRMVDIIHPDDLPSLRRKVSRALKARAPYQFTYRIQTAAGQIKWVWEQGCGVYSPEGRVLALEGFITDVSEHKRAEECIRRMAYYDELTGLPNRLSMRAALSDATIKSGDSHDPLALLHIEIDNFREINETLGYREGDRLLQQVAKDLIDAVGAHRMIARIAESSFSVLLP